MPWLLADYDTGRVLEAEGDCDARFSPCSTFKFPLALMGYDSGVLVDENHPVFDYDPAFDADCLKMLDHWKRPYTPLDWMQHSCVWYSQTLTRRLGFDIFSHYVTAFQYGNMDVSGDAGKNNGLIRSWLGSSLQISPREQVAFIRKFLARQLPVSDDAVRKTARLLYAGDIRGGRLFGKTGSGYLDTVTGQQRGWYVGWTEQGAQKILFAALIDHQGEGFAGQKAREYMTQLLQRYTGRIDSGN